MSVVGRLEHGRAEHTRVVDRIAVAALLARAIARVGDVALDASGDVRRVVQKRDAERIVVSGCDRTLEVALLLIVIDVAQKRERVERGHVVFAMKVTVTAEEPGAVPYHRSAG